MTNNISDDDEYVGLRSKSDKKVKLLLKVVKLLCCVCVRFVSDEKCGSSSFCLIDGEVA